MNPDIDVVVAGHTCCDIHPEFLLAGRPDLAQVFVPGRLLNMGPVAIAAGGVVPNTGLALAWLARRLIWHNVQMPA